VPEIYQEELSQGAYLEEDLGDTTLFEYLNRNRAGDVIAPEASRPIESGVRVAAVPDRGRS